MTALLAEGRGYQLLAPQDDRGLTWEGLPPSHGGPALILAEASTGAMSAYLSARVARQVVPWLHRGALVAAHEHFALTMGEFQADAPAITILATHGGQGLVATAGGHRTVCHCGRRGRMIEGDVLRPRIAQVTWRPGSTLMVLALSTAGALPIGAVGRALIACPTPAEACRHLVHEARNADPHLHHGAIVLAYPTENAA